ncbi:MAG: paraquat-inducible protein A [Acetobacteraceae bacterium]|nr:paraquat-inducible protein A [Acetobacteraceae bacterium]
MTAILRECPICGLFQRVGTPTAGTHAACSRCGSVLRQHRTDPARRALALSIAAVMLFALAATQPFLAIDLGGVRSTTMIAGPEALEQTGLAPLAFVVLATTMLAPAIRLGLTLFVLLAVHRPSLTLPGRRHLARLFRWAEWLEPWSMLEVFLLGVFVAYAKLIDLAPVHVGIAAYALGATMLMTAAADATLDRATVWESIAASAPPQPALPGQKRVACGCCGLVSPVQKHCPRCGGKLALPSRRAIGQSWALLSAAALLYIPANTLPILAVVQLGRGSPHTILQGVVELALGGLWPLAALVFTASIAVPMLKLFGLGYLLFTTGRRSPANLRTRARLYRIVEASGRWSMIDVFMISILTALVQMGALATVTPGPGALCFCAVVILTMLAAHEFDPRLMWDTAAPSPKPDAENRA